MCVCVCVCVCVCMCACGCVCMWVWVNNFWVKNLWVKNLQNFLCRVLEAHYPESASSRSFLLQLFASTSLQEPTCPFYVLYQFILRRPLFNAGGRLLPDLVNFYQWLHEEMSYNVSVETAQDLSISVSLSTFLNSYSPDLRDRRQDQFTRIKSWLFSLRAEVTIPKYHYLWLFFYRTIQKLH